MKEPSYFDVQASIINKKPITDESITKHFVGFTAVKWLSINPLACHTANVISSARGNKYIPKEAEYRFLKNTIKLPKNTYLKDNKTQKEYNIVMKALQGYYSVGRNTMNDYLSILGGEKIMETLDKLCINSNKMTKDASIIELRKAVAKVSTEFKKIKGVK